MTYGRLDVVWPDGPIEYYQLSKRNIAIGRSSGNDIVLDTTAISRYHASITLRESQVYLEDLGAVNGTYVDGQRLDPHNPYPLNGGEQIQFGEVHLTFHPLDDSPTQPISVEEITRRIEYEQPLYHVELFGPDRPVTPGVYGQAKLVIRNLSEDEDRYFIETDGVPRDWVRLERVEAVLAGGEETHLIISFKPLRKPDSKPGDYPFSVRVRSTSRPTQPVDVAGVLHVLSYSGFGIDLGRREIKAGASLPIYVHNQGNAPLPISFEGRNSDVPLTFDFLHPHVTLEAGQRLTTRAKIRPAQPLIVGQTLQQEFIVVARANNAAGFLAPVSGQLSIEPLLTGWRLGALAGVIALAVVVFGCDSGNVVATPTTADHAAGAVC